MDESPYFSDVDSFITFLQETLIPDLKGAGYDATAQDFREAIYWINFYKAKAEASE